LPDIALDLRSVTFMDCAIVGVLIAVYKDVTSAGGCLRIIAPPREPRTLLELCNLDGVLCVHDSVPSATAPVCRTSDGTRRVHSTAEAFGVPNS
jgi:anti-anti-sigma factor